MACYAQNALKKLGLPFSADYVDLLMVQFDKNGDGQVRSLSSAHHHQPVLHAAVGACVADAASHSGLGGAAGAWKYQ